MLEFNSGGYESICIFAGRISAGDGWICLEGPGGKRQELHMGPDWYRQIQFALPEEGIYRIRQEEVSISQIYLSGGGDLIDRGIRFLNPDSGKEVDLGGWYDKPYREQYHFNPFTNWVNDPNGLCWFDGRYHLFYQANPFGQEWNDMYWGHGVSKDLIHWKHMPYALEPQPSLWKDKKRKGGAFSGSAQVEKGEIRLYLTRHDGPQEDGENTREWQTEAVCRDGIHIEEERQCITQKPDGVSFDFRDPKVQRLAGIDYMVLGAALDQIPSILLYRREKGQWQYQGPLIQEREPGIRTFECPDFFLLDGKHVAAGAFMCHRDKANRYQMTRCYIGTFDGQRLHTEAQQWYDFGSNFYAAQTFEHEGRRIAIGWISDFYGEHRKRKNGAYGSFSLPRELHIIGKRLYMEPVKECYSLLKKRIFAAEESGEIERLTSGTQEIETKATGSEGAQETGRQETKTPEAQKTELHRIKIPEIQIPGNSYFAKLGLTGNQDFRLIVAREGKDTLSLERCDGITSLVSTRKEVERVHFPADIKEVRYAEIFVDRRATEVYLNHGEAAGTKLFYQEGMTGHLEGEFETGGLKHLEVWTMESVWNQYQEEREIDYED